MDYPTLLIHAHDDGAVLDQRMKLAVQMAITPGYLQAWREIRDKVERPGEKFPTFARWCADRAADLYEEGLERKWIEPLPMTSTPPLVEVAHARRSAELSVVGQLHAQQTAQELQGQVQRVQSMGGLNG